MLVERRMRKGKSDIKAFTSNSLDRIDHVSLFRKKVQKKSSLRLKVSSVGS